MGSNKIDLKEESVLLEGRQSALFWVFQVAIWTLWLIDGVAAVASGAADWMDWLKISVAAISFAGMAYVGLTRLPHDPPRVDFGPGQLTLRKGSFSPSYLYGGMI